MTSRTLAHPFGARAGRTVRRNLAWPRVCAYLRRHGAVLFSSLAVAGLLMSAVFWATGARGVWLGFLIGAFIATLSCSIAWLTAEASGARAPLIGAMGETWSADALKGLSKRWKRVDSVPFGTSFGVDHVLLSDAGVFAVETKFTASDWSVSSPPLRNTMDNARWKARKVGFLLDIAGRPPVTPVLIVWGPGAPALPGGYALVDGVVICRGSSTKEWPRTWKASSPRSTRPPSPSASPSCATTPPAPSEPTAEPRSRDRPRARRTFGRGYFSRVLNVERTGVRPAAG